ncbi:MAG: hypothetical protein HY874_04165 [Chloroflexi bacterium]|nr:hypothetical protein [Chloroflexota bacterium]
MKRIKRRHGGDIMLIRVDPPLSDLAGEHVNRLIVAPHIAGDEMFPISRWPLHVYVVRTLAQNPEQLEFLDDAESAILDWGELYANEDAVKEVRPLD